MGERDERETGSHHSGGRRRSVRTGAVFAAGAMVAGVAAVGSAAPSQALIGPGGTHTTARLAAGETIRVLATNINNMPVNKTPVIVGNVTAVNPAANGHLRVWNCGADPTRTITVGTGSLFLPDWSTLNYTAGQNTANMVMVDASKNGEVCIYSSAETDVIFDSTSTFTDGDDGLGSTRRVYDSRAGGAPPVKPGQVVEVQTSATGGAPVALNLIAVNPKSGGHFRVWACDKNMPDTSVVTYRAGQTTSGFTVSLTSAANAKVCVYTSAEAGIVVDQAGVLSAETLSLLDTPVRLLDTRKTRTVEAGETVRVTDVTTPAVGTVTAVNPSAAGHLRVWRCDQSMPGVSSLNFYPGGNTSNMFVSGHQTNAAGTETCIYSSARTDIIVDVVGRAGVTVYPYRAADTRSMV